MDNYEVGKKCSGRVISFYQGNLIIELETGIIGKVIAEAKDVSIDQGDCVEVVVKQKDEYGIILELVSGSKEPEKSDGAEMWKNIVTGHRQAMAIMVALQKYADEFLRELTVARKEWEGAKSSSQQIYDTIVANAMKQCEDERQRFTIECENDIAETKKRRETAQKILDACYRFLISIPNNDSIEADESTEGIQDVQDKFQDVNLAITSKVDALRKLCNCGIAESEQARDKKLNQARTEQIERDTLVERRFSTRQKEICTQRRSVLYNNFNKDSIREYQQKIVQSRFQVDNYECPSAVPDYVMLGNIGVSIPNVSREDMEVVQIIESQMDEVGSKQSGNYIVKIPYAQRLSEGISLLMRYGPSERNYVQGLIQPLLLKLFMSFPAGKLEATMIDPLEIGASFFDIPKLAEGPNSSRVIDTKIWSNEKDIENAISALRQRLENINQAYGGNQGSRLKKEVIRALAITDFPNGFTDTALKDLHTIVRNSSSLGVCVLICANEEELEKLRQKKGELVAEIEQSVIGTRASGKRLMFTGADGERIFLEVDEMQDVFQQKHKIIPFIRDAIEHTQLKVEHFESMFEDDIYDSNNWFTGNHNEIAIPIGIKGADIVVKLVLGRGGGSTEHHALISGHTGAGKSTFLHTLIMSTLISYSPDEVQMYLLDFKEGVEFNAYTRYRLPSLRVIAINSEREFGLHVLKELSTELEKRTKYFSRYNVSDINSYSRLFDVPKMPKLLLIFDEVQELFRDRGGSDSISSECLSLLGRILAQGRALGIHVILACQDFHNCAGLEAFFSHMAIRIAIKGSENGAASILSADNNGIRTLQDEPAGAAIYNNGGGVDTANNFFQISYLEGNERLKLLERLHAYFTDPDVAPLYEEQQTRVLLNNAQDNANNCFNRLIANGFGSIEVLGKSKDGYGLLLGQGFGKKSSFMPELRTGERENLLVVSTDEKVALSLFVFSIMSVLYEELHTDEDKNHTLVYIVDLLADELEDDECDFDFLKMQFEHQVEVVKVGAVDSLITGLYDMVLRRSEGSLSSTERIFLMFFGINRARNLRTGRIYEKESEEELNSIEMLRKIIINGPKLGVNSIVWGESIHGIEQMLGDRYDFMFNKRIAYNLDAASMDILVAESESKLLHGKTAVYMDIGQDVKNTHFRPYDVPLKEWVEEYAKTYKEIINEGE